MVEVGSDILWLKEKGVLTGTSQVDISKPQFFTATKSKKKKKKRGFLFCFCY
jgi:hypothetical protein